MGLCGKNDEALDFLYKLLTELIRFNGMNQSVTKIKNVVFQQLNFGLWYCM